uniref:SH2 domain-containing protein n=1 Tax=Mola mola TaxID=94237 RepID=A0A3Q4B069_MOLML
MQILIPLFCFCFSFPDNNFKPPQRPPKKPLRPAKGSKQLPPEPNHMGRYGVFFTFYCKYGLKSYTYWKCDCLKFFSSQFTLFQDADVHNKSWYAGACDRKTADDVLLRANKDGAFMVRKSSGHDAQQPYTLVVFYKDRVYNIPVRFIPTTQQYALGREKKGEEYFSSVCHIIESHQRNHLVLIDSQSNTKDMTKLSYPTRPPPH